MRKLPIIILILLISVMFFFEGVSKKSGDFYIRSHISNNSTELFTEEEKRWLNENRDRIFYVGVAQDYTPIEYIDDKGQPRGIGIEIIKKVNEATGLTFKLIDNNHEKTWADILENIKTNRVDVLPAVSFTQEREEYLDFSIPYIEMTQVVVGHNDKYKFVKNFRNVQDESFAVPRGYWFQNDILKQNPKARIIEVENMEEAIRLVSDKEADYTVCEIPVFTYYKENKYKNIRIVGELDFNNKIHLGINKELSGLIPIVNKVIANINYKRLYESSLIVLQNNSIDEKLIFTMIFMTVGLAVTVYLLFKTYRKLIKAKHEAVNANKDKSNLMANISHDLRTPITVAMGYLEAIIDDEVRKEEEKTEYVKKTYQKLKYLSALIDDFFFLSRIEDSKLKLNKEKTNINKFIRSIAENMELRSKAREIKLVMKLAHTDVIKEIDRLKFHRALENIIMNAVKHSNDGGKIEIGTTLLEEGKIKIHIRDDGVGIHEDDIPHIFQRYYKGKNAKEESIGLGLYIAKEIIEKHNGDIWIESELHKGTTFYIIL